MIESYALDCLTDVAYTNVYANLTYIHPHADQAHTDKPVTRLTKDS
jgi:hypothetical protein